VIHCVADDCIKLEPFSVSAWFADFRPSRGTKCSVVNAIIAVCAACARKIDIVASNAKKFTVLYHSKITTASAHN
jgi:hypothetical protein